MTNLSPNDLSHLSDEQFNALAPQGYHATGPAEALSPAENCITFAAPATEEVMRIDKEGFHYRGQFIADAGEAHRLMLEFLKQNTRAMTNLITPPSELVQRVATTLHGVTNSDPNVPVDEWMPEARAVIYIVAAWLREQDARQ
jgi:hypothetical protein